MPKKKKKNEVNDSVDESVTQEVAQSEEVLTNQGVSFYFIYFMNFKCII